jgi:uncharacterized protein involved in cysteine biosynthesis
MGWNEAWTSSFLPFLPSFPSLLASFLPPLPSCASFVSLLLSFAAFLSVLLFFAFFIRTVCYLISLRTVSAALLLA